MIRIKNRKIAELRPCEYNPRQLSLKEAHDLETSLERFGMVDPIILNMHADRRNVVIGGHQRLRIWQGMGKRTIPVVELELDLARERVQYIGLRLEPEREQCQ